MAMKKVPETRARRLLRKAALRALTTSLAVAFHVVVFGFILSLRFLIFVQNPNPVALRFDNPYRGSLESRVQDDDGVVIVFGVRKNRRWPEFETPKPAAWESARLKFRRSLGKPVRYDPFPSSRKLFVNNQWESMAKGEDLEFCSDKPFRGRAIYDTYGAGGGGGGRYGNAPGGQDAVHQALGWLLRHRNPDGSWSAKGYTARCKEECLPNPVTGDLDAAVTGLAVLAFLGARYTPDSKETWDGVAFGAVIREGAAWLAGRQDSDGRIGPRESSPLNHRMGALALSEAHRASGSSLWGDEAKRAVAFTVGSVDSWNPMLPSQSAEAYRTGWAVLGVRSALLARLEVPDAARESARGWHDVASDLDFLEAMGPEDAHDGDLAFFAALGVAPWRSSGEHFCDRFRSEVAESLIGAQNRQEGACRAGSWEPKEEGRVYATALRALILECASGYLPNFTDADW